MSRLVPFSDKNRNSPFANLIVSAVLAQLDVEGVESQWVPFLVMCRSAVRGRHIPEVFLRVGNMSRGPKAFGRVALVVTEERTPRLLTADTLAEESGMQANV